MKYAHFLRLGVLVAALVLAGCAKPADPGQANETTIKDISTSTPAARETTNVAQLQDDWTLINFGAPW